MKNLIRLLFVIVSVLLLVLVSASRPVRASTDAEFIGFLEEAWVNAIIQKNVDVLDRVMADDFVGVSPNGEPYDKQEAIEDIRSGLYAVERMDLENVKVRVLGDLAIDLHEVTGRERKWPKKPAGNHEPGTSKQHHFDTSCPARPRAFHPRA